jgi:type II secretory pathway component PulC
MKIEEQKKEEISKDVLSKEEEKSYNEVALALAVEHKVSKVHPYVGIDPITKERIVGYLKEPNYVQKLFALDRIANGGIFMAADEMREVLTIKEASDERTFSTDSSCDSYRLGMAAACVPIIEVINNSFKKK